MDWTWAGAWIGIRRKWKLVMGWKRSQIKWGRGGQHKSILDDNGMGGGGTGHTEIRYLNISKNPFQPVTHPNLVCSQ